MIELQIVVQIDNILVLCEVMTQNRTPNTPEVMKVEVKKWVDKFYGEQEAEVSVRSLSKCLCEGLLNKNNIVKQEQDDKHSPNIYEHLFNHNEHFSLCLREISENIIHFAYSHHQCRTVLPTNLIGYYEVVKNLLHNSIQGYFPPTVKSYLQYHLIELIFNQFTIHELKVNLLRYENSDMYHLFMKQLAALITMRIKMFQKLFFVEFLEPAQEIIKVYLMQDSEETEMEARPMIDEILVCTVYSSYKIKKQKVLFGKVGKLYEQVTHKSLRSTLVDFYNRHFVSEIQEKIPMALMEKVVILKKGVLMFTGEHIDEERSIFDMFG